MGIAAQWLASGCVLLFAHEGFEVSWVEHAPEPLESIDLIDGGWVGIVAVSASSLRELVWYRCLFRVLRPSAWYDAIIQTPEMRMTCTSAVCRPGSMRCLP